MPVHQKGQLELGTDTIGTGDKHRTLNTLQIQLKQSTKSADGIHDTGGHRAGHMLFHQFNGSISGGDIHTCRLVAVAVTAHFKPPFCRVSRHLFLSGKKVRSPHRS